VIENVRTLLADRLQGGGVAFEIRDQHLNRTAGIAFPGEANGVGKHGGTAVREFVPIHRRDNGMAESQRLYRFGDTPGFLRIYRLRAAGLHRTVVAPSRADIAENEKCRGAGIPAFPSIGTTGLFTDRVKF
jgi:hypothetical protein